MWKRSWQGQALVFHLAGINNQNFIMRDEQTGSFWQQVTGMAISGPLKGAHLELVRNDELSFALWKAESPGGVVLAPDTRFSSDYETKDWEVHIGKLPVSSKLAAGSLPTRETVIGIAINGQARAYPVAKILQQSPLQDSVGGMPVLLITGPDKLSIRAFISRIPPQDQPAEFFRPVADGASEQGKSATPSTATPQDWKLLDSATNSEWNFQGCAVSGPAEGKCLEPIAFLKDYWFDWHNYHPDTSVYNH